MSIAYCNDIQSTFIDVPMWGPMNSEITCMHIVGVLVHGFMHSLL